LTRRFEENAVRRLIALILLVFGAAVLVGSTGISLAAFSLPADRHSSIDEAIYFKNDLAMRTALFTDLRLSEAPLSSLEPTAVNEPAPHFPQRCRECHASVGDCALCHQEDAPRGDHPNLLICASCHQPPAQAGQGVETWHELRIDHSSQLFADCQSCHSTTAPAGHYQAQCSACHTPPAAGSAGGWSNVQMDHQAGGLTDCQSCHAQMRPANHFAGQCSACHNTSGWSGARFNHQGTRDCQNCHNPPRDHYGGECKLCHSPARAWNKANFSWHKFNMDHGGANGNCSTCHTRNGTNCTSCHESEEGDDDHGGDGDD
jgi:hypothetical protein